ncbi:hypothetical protein, partial [Pseudomonas sp. FW305-BF6]|uniref:hypothetical protein n=1 Tax=Pseudomonas sp. FW305-BF6 TaxID=2070673 RepID=UPI001C47512B
SGGLQRRRVDKSAPPQLIRKRTNLYRPRLPWPASILPKVIHNVIPGVCAQVTETAGFLIRS